MSERYIDASCLDKYGDDDVIALPYQTGIAVGTLRSVFAALPEAKDVRKERFAEWIDGGSIGSGVLGVEYHQYTCSACGYAFSKLPRQRFPKYCEECGAKMRTDNG